MAYEQKDNSGTLGRNDRKTQPNHPDHKGKCIVNGAEYWVSAWVKQGPTGKFFSLAFTPKDAQYKAPAANSGVQQSIEDSDIPF